MAQVTIELRHLLQTDFELFDFDYPFDDKQFAKELEQAVINYYYFSEIGQPTPDKFKHVFKSRWLSMIGYYNQLHNTTLLKYNPLINYKMEEALEQLKQSDSTQDNTLTTTTEGQAVADRKRTDNLQTATNTDEKTSDYPQQPINGDFLAGQRVVDSNTTNTGTVTSEDSATTSDHTEQEGTQKIVGTENTNYQKTIEGLTGITYQELIQKERENLIRIKQMVIQELKPCFLLVY